VQAGGATRVGGPDPGLLEVGALRTTPAGVTVIVPVHGPGPHLDDVLAALQLQLPPVERIIVSHSGEGDPRSRFVNVKDVTVLHSPDRLFAGAARNRGMALATTEWVAFVDEDVMVDGHWHAALLEAIALRQADCIVGSIGVAQSGGYWGMSLWFAEFSSVHPYLAAKPLSSGASANLAVRRELFASIGGFPNDWRTAEDALAQARLEERGHRIRFEPGVLGRHVNLPGIGRMMRYLFCLGGSSAKLRRMYPALTGGRAVRWPVLSLGLWLARLFHIYGRVLRAQNGPIISLALYTPGVLIGLLAWNAGFSKEAFGFAGRCSTRERHRHLPIG
jgi:glycosyltransferase involved in cell wall biosynthesis